MATLSSRAGTVLSRRQLPASVWGETSVGNDNIVDVNVGHLLRKLGDDPALPRYVTTGARRRVSHGHRLMALRDRRSQPSQWRRGRHGIRMRLLVANSVVVIACIVTTSVVAEIVGPPMFRRLMDTAVVPGLNGSHPYERAFRDATALSVGIALAVSALAALTLSWYLSHRVHRSATASRGRRPQSPTDSTTFEFHLRAWAKSSMQSWPRSEKVAYGVPGRSRRHLTGCDGGLPRPRPPSIGTRQRISTWCGEKR
ncbi:putative membrane protein [Mycobacterium sp. URHB0021]